MLARIVCIDPFLIRRVPEDGNKRIVDYIREGKMMRLLQERRRLLRMKPIRRILLWFFPNLNGKRLHVLS